MRNRLWIIFWILGILFPIAFLSHFWPPFGRLFDTVFSPDWIHIAMHAFLYAVLALLLAQWIRPASPKAVASIMALAVAVGCLQEWLQGLSPGHGFTWSASAFDLLVDAGGAALGLVLTRCWSLHRKKSPLEQK